LRPLILITNDDGIDSPGLHAMAAAVQDLGDLLIAAPMEQQTSMGRGKPKLPGNGVVRTVRLSLNGHTQEAYAIQGSPALCVAHAIYELAPRKPDLCLSGINYGENIGTSLSASGTVGAAIEAADTGVPALAFSLETPLAMNHAAEFAELDWKTAQHFTRVFTEKALRTPFPAGVSVLNINVPLGADTTTPIRWTRVSRQRYYSYIQQPARDPQQPFRLHEDKLFEGETLEPDSDIRALLIDRLISVAPLTRDMTAQADMQAYFS
jgi:5'-nucleotidase